MHPSTRATHAKIAALSRSRKPDDPELVAARRQFKEQRIIERLRLGISDGLPLEPEQYQRIHAAVTSAALGGGDGA